MRLASCRNRFGMMLVSGGLRESIWAALRVVDLLLCCNALRAFL
jgi:hypothetical protein